MSIAKSYAKALYNAANEAKANDSDLDGIQIQLQGMAQILSTSPEASLMLLAPSVSSQDKVKLVTAFAKRLDATQIVGAFLALLARKERLALLPELPRVFEAVRLEAEGGVLGQVVSADPISDSDLKTLADAFTGKLGKKVSFKAQTDPALLAGIKVTVSGVTYDGTLSSQLQRLRDRVVQGTAVIQ